MSGTALEWLFGGWFFGKQDDAPNAESRAPFGSGHEHSGAHVASGTELLTEPLTERARRDLDLIARIRGSDTQAFAELMEAYGDQLANVAYAIVKTSGVAQEIVQDVFFQVWQRRHALDIHGSVAAYLVRAARNRALNVARRDGAQQRFADETRRVHTVRETGVTNAGDDELTREELYAAVVAAIDELQPRRREIFLLHTDQGLRPSEIAEVLGIAPATVHTHIYRATKYLADRLKMWR